jgi:Flp pilus assembly protein TadD
MTADEAASLGRLAADLMAAGDPAGACLLLEGLTVLNPDDAMNWAALGVAHHAAGNTEQAEASYRECLKRDAACVTALAYLGELLLGRGEPEGRKLVQTAMADVTFAASDAGQRLARIAR